MQFGKIMAVYSEKSMGNRNTLGKLQSLLMLKQVVEIVTTVRVT
jgi:hypothetical protein